MNISIGELAKRADCKVVTVRYYEKEGLLPKTRRSAANYRVYDQEALERLEFIRHCRNHGMNLDEIRALLEYRDTSRGDCVWINRMVDKHMDNLDKQIRSLTLLRDQLGELRQRCQGGGTAVSCGILQCLVDSGTCACERGTPKAAPAE